MYPAGGCLWAGLAMNQKKILVVDDDPDVRLALQVRLNANHYDVVCAGDGVTSISEAQKQKPDLIILDLGLPAGDGFSVLQRMKANERLASIPVIVLSGRDHVDNRDRAIKAGAKTFLQKPMEHGKLMAIILLVLEAKEAAASSHDRGNAGPKNPSPSARGVMVGDEGLDV
jgi:DNA-binding response OmpR family regulator